MTVGTGLPGLSAKKSIAAAVFLSLWAASMTGFVGCGRGGTGGADAGAGTDGRGTGGGGAAGSGGAPGGGGNIGACVPPASCEGYDDRPDAGITAMITCLSPSTAPRNVPLALAIYGHHLATGPGQNAIVTVGAGVALNGVPATACHLDVQVPADQIAAAGESAVVVSPGGWTRASAPVSLTVE